jgi:FkbH-like protein
MRRLDLLPDEAASQLATLVAAVEVAEAIDLPWQKRIRIHFLRNFTIEPLEPYLRFQLLRRDIQAQISYGGYDTMQQEMLDPGSDLNRTRPHLIVVSLLPETLDRASATAGWQAGKALARLDDLFAGLIARTNALIVANTVLPPVDALLASEQDASRDAQLERLNDWLRTFAMQQPGRVVLSDWVERFSRIGSGEALDARFWKLSQAPFKRDFLNQYAADIADAVQGLNVAAKKCLVLDCDNTLWGGVVGEDGLDGIHLNADDARGSPYYRLQQSVLVLQERGVMIALCSKNNEQDVWDVLDSHPGCLLRKSHLVAWRINWDNKADNIAAIAAELNIGLDSMVFVDDSPQECALVRELLPEVTSLQLPENLRENANFLITGGLFDGVAVTSEDRMRTQLYQQEAQRKKERGSASDLTAYLKSLETEVRIARAGADELARVAQLTQKTNQFNLTTRRYSEAEIQKYATSGEAAVFSMSVVDRYGDMGLTGVLIARREGAKGVVDTLLLSCRVLGRQLEYAFIDQCLLSLEEDWRLEQWDAEYIATRKNSQVADFWERVGFDLAQDKGGHRSYTSKKFSRPRGYLNIMTVHRE